MANFIDLEAMRQFNYEAFARKQPFPWVDFKDFLLTEGFQKLYQDFPNLDFFEYHENLYRLGQRPHNRYYLAYERSTYRLKDPLKRGVIGRNDLQPSWQHFIDELESDEYQSFIAKALNVSSFKVRYAWHIGKETNEVSPHRDSSDKIGTHIFYFNTQDDWETDWGGELLILGGKMTSGITPDFKDFISSAAVSNTDNHSFLFKNTSQAWHGVKELNCPEGKYRKLFNVIFSDA
ncbi:Uncharacterized protein PHSC3_001621 [Chlamydiales bacterium STE3]|nr:Uncharacterized protein PHSC3_001621 [Chlamydiales bacterium STE3]